MCEDCENRDIRTFTAFVDPKTGKVLRKVYDVGIGPSLQEQIAELTKRIAKLEKALVYNDNNS